MTAADKYYLKAKENYPYNIEDVLEALDYGLSCDDTHAGLLTLQGNIYCNDLKQFDMARENYELALYHDPIYVDAYYAYIKLCMQTGSLDKAEQLIVAANKVKGIDRAYIRYNEALLQEKQGLLQDAVKTMKLALHQCDNKCNITLLEEEMERVQKKMKNLKESNTMLNIIIK